MSAIAETHDTRPVIHPVWLRITHWINAIAMIVMIMSGWEIYNASPLFAFRFTRTITLGGWLATMGALLPACAYLFGSVAAGMVGVFAGIAAATWLVGVSE